MEQTPILKRLYVGGLAHSISEAELQERFSKFGKVSEIEIVTRKDEQGIPTKTFAYINITLSEKELKRCLSILNKTKWKGGTLQIELAKESFLHRNISLQVNRTTSYLIQMVKMKMRYKMALKKGLQENCKGK
uniref:Nucleolar protein 8 n=2 Tax=Salvator merianae TaxID=96440 RepID=A0A8D0C114_SALMN